MYLNDSVLLQSWYASLDFSESLLRQCRVGEVCCNLSANTDSVLDSSLTLQSRFDDQLQQVRQTANRCDTGVVHPLRHVSCVVAQHHVHLHACTTTANSHAKQNIKVIGQWVHSVMRAAFGKWQ